MSGYQAKKAIAGLKTLLESAKLEKQRFHGIPLFAVGAFVEGRSRASMSEHLGSFMVARFLNIPETHVVMLQGECWTNRDTTYDGPYFVYRRPEQRADSQPAQHDIRNALASLNSFVPQLLEQVQAIPVGLRGRPIPDEVPNWWTVLFHLAIHYPQPLLAADRRRWINVTGPAPGIDPRRTIPFDYPRASHTDERQLQFGDMQAPFDDIVPGVMWSVLRDSVFTSTVRAVEVLVDWLEAAVVEHPPVDWPVVRRRFAELHGQFQELAELEARFHRPNQNESESDNPLRFYSECRLIKLASSFRMPPAHRWCGFPMRLAFNRLCLSRHHADAEYFVHRQMLQNFHPLCEQAGTALPHT